MVSHGAVLNTPKTPPDRGYHPETCWAGRIAALTLLGSLIRVFAWLAVALTHLVPLQWADSFAMVFQVATIGVGAALQLKMPPAALSLLVAFLGSLAPVILGQLAGVATSPLGIGAVALAAALLADYFALLTLDSVSRRKASRLFCCRRRRQGPNATKS